MKERKYMLTISILASNRKDTLPKTLESIKPILDNVSSELIVTDTGCDNELLEHIRLYTDKIEKFQWCDDFSKARNVGLKLSQGKWFMFIDDDEWFEEVDEIIHFFNSGECEKYKSFYYIVRNYINLEGTAWKDTPVNRGILMDDEIEFQDIIHEHFSKYLRPTKMFDAYAHHYGYAHATKDASDKHTKRNLELLEKQMAEGRMDMRQHVHLLQEYNGFCEYEKVYELALHGIEQAEKSKEINRRFLGGIKANLIYALMKLEKYDEMVELSRKYIRDGGLTMTAYCAINAFSCIGHWNMYNEDEVIKTAIEYFSLRDYVSEDMKQMIYDSMLIIPKAFEGSIPEEVFSNGLMCAVRKKDDNAAIMLMKHQHYVNILANIGDGMWLQELVDMMTLSKEKSVYAKTIVAYMSDMICATKICNRLLDMREENPDNFMSVVGELVNEKSDNTYLKLLKTVYYGLKGEVDKLKQQ